MRTLFDGDAHVHYAQIYVESDDRVPSYDLDAAFAGQANGLCGASTPGFLFLVTGLHTGIVPFTVELHDEAPRVDASWEEVVEASFAPSSPRIALVEWAGEESRPLDLPQVPLRVRYCASGMDEAHEADTRFEGEPVVDRYLLQLWPAPEAPDRVVKQSSQNAAYWHRTARELPPPPSPAEMAEARRQAERAEAEGQRQLWDRIRWGDRQPSDRLRQVGGNVLLMMDLDRALVDAIAEEDPQVQRAIARWAAHQAYEAAGIAHLDWVVPALEALDHGQPLPPPFDDAAQALDRLWSDESVPQTAVSSFADPGRAVSQQAAAVSALLGAVEADPLHAALDALYAAAIATGGDPPPLLREVRRAFPGTDRPG